MDKECYFCETDEEKLYYHYRTAEVIHLWKEERLHPYEGIYICEKCRGEKFDEGRLQAKGYEGEESDT